MSTPTLATNDEYILLSPGPAETAIETGSLCYRFERDSEQFAVFETPEERSSGGIRGPIAPPRTIGSLRRRRSRTRRSSGWRLGSPSPRSTARRANSSSVHSVEARHGLRPRNEPPEGALSCGTIARTGVHLPTLRARLVPPVRSPREGR
jgi:hypothetical protein